jgi:curved DNA-binding protein CbpA
MDTMNYHKACEVLEIVDSNPTIETVRKQYKYLALKWHPDRNTASNATDKYREIKEAHDFLLDQLDKGFVPQMGQDNYAGIASMFFETLYNNEHFQRKIFHPLLMMVVGMCEEKALTFIYRLQNCSPDRASKLCVILESYKHVLHLSDEFFEKIRKKQDDSDKSHRHILLNPNIDDLMMSNVCKLEDEGIIVPLWHSLLEYEKEGLIVHCLPELPPNVWIDESECSGTVHVEIDEDINKLWKTGKLEFSIGSIKKSVKMERIRFCKRQIVELEGEGFPVADRENVFNVSKNGLLMVHLNLE